MICDVIHDVQRVRFRSRSVTKNADIAEEATRATPELNSRERTTKGFSRG